MHVKRKPQIEIQARVYSAKPLTGLIFLMPFYIWKCMREFSFIDATLGRTSAHINDLNLFSATTKINMYFRSVTQVLDCRHQKRIPNKYGTILVILMAKQISQRFLTSEQIYNQ